MLMNIYSSDSQPAVHVHQEVEWGYAERLRRSLTNLKKIDIEM